MSDHEFEKQVRQKLDDLKLTPSPHAWENIEEGLRDGKRRRAPFLWLSLLLAGLLAGGYFIYTSDPSSPPPASNDPAIGKAPTKQPAEIISRPGIDNFRAKSNKLISSDKNISEQNKTSEINSTLTSSTKNNLDRSLQNLPVEESIIEHKYINSNNPHIKSGDGADAEQKIPVETITGKESGTSSANNPPAEIFNEGRLPLISSTGSKTNPGLLNPDQNKDQKLPSAQTKPATQKKKKTGKWSFGISGFAGISAVNEGQFLNFRKPEVEDVSYTPSFAQPSFAPVYKPSTISPGFSFSVGGVLKRQLSKKFSLTTGLNYLQLNTLNKVGSQMYGGQVVNTGTRGYMYVSNYYTLDQDRPSEYRNRYHFIEVPLSLHTRINKSEKLPLNWNVGVSVSRLLKSNSLHFDGTTGIYYKNDKLLNQTQVAATTGFSFTLFNKTKHPLWIGPSARYNISKILQRDISASKNFMSLGIETKLFIK